MNQEKRAGTVRVLAPPGLDAPLPEEGSLLVARKARDREREAEVGRVGFGDDTGGRDHPRQNLWRHAEEA
jgi:hypothetical protein